MNITLEELISEPFFLSPNTKALSKANGWMDHETAINILVFSLKLGILTIDGDGCLDWPFDHSFLHLLINFIFSVGEESAFFYVELIYTCMSTLGFTLQ